MRHISENELDALLNQTFLNLDFENARNSEVLEIVGNYNMRKNFLARLFNPQRLNLLLLILSAFIFLNSFYRYLEPIINKNDKNDEPIPGISTVKKNVLPELKKNVTAESQNVTDLKKNEHSRENNSKPEQEDKRANVKPVIPIKIEKADSMFLKSLAVVEKDTINNFSKSIANDPIDIIPKSKIQSIAPAIKKSKAERKVTPKLTTKKGKTPRVGRGAKFRKNGTFIMKGGRYGKSRRIQR